MAITVISAFDQFTASSCIMRATMRYLRVIMNVNASILTFLLILAAPVNAADSVHSTEESVASRVQLPLFGHSHSIGGEGYFCGTDFESEEARANLAAYRAAREEMTRDDMFRVVKDLETQMKESARNLMFEKAAQLRDEMYELRRILALEEKTLAG